MGFYGNITDTSRTHFQFDKIFPSRTEMDRACTLGTDNIFTGRFVLVKYNPDSKYFQGDMLYGYRENDINDAAVYADRFCENPYIFTDFIKVTTPSKENCTNYYFKSGRFYFKLPNASYYSEDDKNNYYTPTIEGDNIVGENQIVRLRDNTGALTGVFLQCQRGVPGEPAIWNEIITDEDYSNYFINYQLDFSTYGADFDTRGYDATVWQKIYSEGVGRFIQIARLNGSVPGFELFPNPPSLYAEAPYIDAKSTDDYYRIHVPSHWGFNFKQSLPVAQGGFSEEVVTYDKRVYDAEGKNYTVIPTEINADIYTNKRGATVASRFRDDATKNAIQLTPTGESGKIYYDKDGNQVKKDTFELSIHLPAIGNSISDAYDMIYGYNRAADTPQPRYTDIDWIDGAYSDEQKRNGLDNKKTHDLRTIAGTLNTMHDRLGQIICHLNSLPSDSQTINLSDNYIYEYNGTLYRRGVKYRKITVEDYIYRIAHDITEANYEDAPPQGDYYYYRNGVDSEGNAVYIAITNPAERPYDPLETYYYRDSWCKYQADPNARNEFTTNKYYENIGSTTNPIYVPSMDTAYKSGKTYYLKNINPSRYTEIALTKYLPGNFYYKEGENYICDWSSPNPSDPYRSYYKITSPVQKELSAGYEAGKYYRENEETGAFERDYAELPDPTDNRPYYDYGQTTKMPAFGGEERIIYTPNVFYYENTAETDPEKIGKLFLLTAPSITDDMYAQYNIYSVTFSDIPQYGLDANGDMIEYYPATGTQKVHTAGQAVNRLLVNPEKDIVYYYISSDENIICPYTNLHNIMANPYSSARRYYTIDNVSKYPADLLYLPGKYYIYDSTGTRNYIKANDTFDEDAAYYILTSENITLIKNPFYLQHKYYYYDSASGLYIYADDPFMDTTKAPFYEQTKMYVDTDDANECPHGYEWSEYAPYIPPSIHLYAREPYLGLIEMDNIYSGDPDFSSVNGALLHLHQTYDPLNNETRDRTTFRGSLNTLQDILYQLKRLVPGKICYVNSFGQITSTDIDYEELKEKLALIH